MATDFFDRQDHARRQTLRLLVLFALAVAAIIAAIYLALVLSLQNMGPRPPNGHDQLVLWQPEVFVWVALGTLSVISLASLFKISELSAGGEQIALMLGGRAVNPQTTNLAERRLLNIVEEMSLASGIPVPPVYVLDNEPSINAFAAGHQPGDAVVAVSAGCLQFLNREELQGVMAHEFSHILNGDMRLNLRLIGIVYGILVLAVLGYYMLRIGDLSRGSKKDSGAGAIALLGIVLMVFGYIGVFFGKLIKSAISRQREFLADASAVQFTRYPGGIAGALKKIGGLSEGSRIRDAHAEEISHMFFGDSFAGAFFNLFATHPPLPDRIRALEPEFDGEFPEVRPVTIKADDIPPKIRKTSPPLQWGGVIGIPALSAATAAPPPPAINAQNLLQRIGQPQAENLGLASQFLDSLPESLLNAAREPFLAQAVVYTLLLSRDDQSTHARQLELLRNQITPPLYEQVQQLAAAAQTLPPTARLPLVELAIPALKKSSPQQYVQLRQIVDALVGVDSKVDLFEYCLRMVLLSYLDVHFGIMKSPSVRYRTLGALSRPAAVVLSTLAHVGHESTEDIQRAYSAGMKNIAEKPAIMPPEQCTLKTFDDAAAELAQASPKVKRELLAAVTACITCDGTVTLEESELLRAIAAVLACPVPPLAAA